jgi:hypothetical protein
LGQGAGDDFEVKVIDFGARRWPDDPAGVQQTAMEHLP